VPDLHVLEDLGDDRPIVPTPTRAGSRGEQDGAAAQLDLAVDVDDLADVAGVVSPRVSITLWRMSSSSLPMSSMSSG
jgi:hypothetical protein